MCVAVWVVVGGRRLGVGWWLGGMRYVCGVGVVGT